MNSIGELTVVLIVAIIFTFIGYFGGQYDANKDFCQQKGGVYVQGSEGWLCMKGEKL
jgi:hypothetical protein